MKQYHVSVDGQQPTVVAEDVLAKEAAEGKYPANTLIWCEGMAGWEPIGKHFKPSFSSRLDGVMAKVPLGKLKSLKIRFSAGVQRLKRPLPPRLKKLLLILAGVGICLVILFSIALISGQSRKNQLAAAYSEMVTCIGEEDWSELYEKFDKHLGDEWDVSSNYSDGTRRDKELYNDEELYSRAFRRTRVTPRREKLAGSENIYTRYSVSELRRSLKGIESQLRHSDPDKVSKLKELLRNKEAMKQELYIRCEMDDFSSTLFLISFLADGVVNTPLAAAVNLAYELKKENIEEQDMAILVCKNFFRKFIY